MNEIQRELRQAKSTCLKDLVNKFGSQLKQAQKTFVDQSILRDAINSEKTTGWNNAVKDCKPVTFMDKKFILVQDVNERAFYLVDEDKVTETALKYLKAYVEDFEDDEFI